MITHKHSSAEQHVCRFAAAATELPRCMHRCRKQPTGHACIEGQAPLVGHDEGSHHMAGMSAGISAAAAELPGCKHRCRKQPTGHAGMKGQAPLVGHDEGAPHIAVFHQAFPIWQAQLSAHLDGCWPRAIWHGHYAVDLPACLPAQSWLDQHLLARVVGQQCY